MDAGGSTQGRAYVHFKANFLHRIDRFVTRDGRLPPRSTTAAPLGNHSICSRRADEASRARPADASLPGSRFGYAPRSRPRPPPAAQTDDQMLRFLNDEPVPNLAAISGLAAEDRELLSALMDSLTNFRTQLRGDNNMLFSRKIHPLIELADRLHAQAELSVPTVA